MSLQGKQTHKLTNLSAFWTALIQSVWNPPIKINEVCLIDLGNKTWDGRDGLTVSHQFKKKKKNNW